tara:strand:- start:168 stop:455 length:288 start_codon:yes stop_codon:yes gene_type:complete
MEEIIFDFENDNEIDNMIEVIKLYNSRFNDIQFETEIEFAFNSDDMMDVAKDSFDGWANGEEAYAQMLIRIHKMETCEVEWENLLYDEWKTITAN